MGGSGYQRLSAQDSSFVRFEGEGVHVHISAIAIFGRSPDAGEASGAAPVPAIERLRRHIGARLHLIPHYRQRLAFTPIQGHPIWVDDENFDLAYHVRIAALPRPGTEEQLRELTGHLISQPLDRGRPLWELWLVEGLEEGGFAIVAKVHHCMTDGVSGVGVINALMSPSRDARIERAPKWKPQPPPGTLQFLTDGLGESARLGVSAVQSLAGSLLQPIETASSLLETANLGFETLRNGFTPPARTPLNAPIGTQRRIARRSLDLSEVLDVKKRLDGTVNDVVLSTVGGAMRRYLKRRRTRLAGMDYRVIVPVDTRTGEEDENIGNKVSAWFLSIPIGEPNTLRRFRRVRSQTRRLKRSGAEGGVDAFLRFSDWAGSTRLPFWGVSLANWVRPYNLIVTNVHGPQFPLYLLGAPLREFTPLLPLFRNQGLAVAAMSYLGRIDLGVTADRDLVPDIERFGDALDESFADLQRVAARR